MTEAIRRHLIYGSFYATVGAAGLYWMLLWTQ